MNNFKSSKNQSNGIFKLNNINQNILSGRWPGSLVNEESIDAPEIELLLKFEGQENSRTYNNSANTPRWFSNSRATSKSGLQYGDGSITTSRAKFGNSCYYNRQVGQQSARDGIIMYGNPILIKESFTIECWVYITSFSSNSGNIFNIYDNLLSGKQMTNFDTPGYLSLRFNNSGQLFFSHYFYQKATTSSNSSSSLNANAWNHVALVCKNNFCTVFLNGSKVLSYHILSSTLTQIATGSILSQYRPHFFTGLESSSYNSSNGNTVSNNKRYISKQLYLSCFTNIAVSNSFFADELIFTNHSAKYDNNFEVPSETNISTSSILYYNNFENEEVNVIGTGQRDLTNLNVPLFGGNFITNSDKKFGNSCLQINNQSQQTLMNPKCSISGDFNISLWVKTSNLNEAPIFFIGPSNTCYLRIGGGTYYDKGGFQSPNVGAITFSIGNTNIKSANNIVTINTWHHIHISRNNNTIRIFLNGNQVASGSSNLSIIEPYNTLVIGHTVINYYIFPIFSPTALNQNMPSHYLAGFIDEFIIDNKTGLTSVVVPTNPLAYIRGM